MNRQQNQNQNQNQNRNRNNDPAVFVNATLRTPQNGGNYYVWSKTFDLRDVAKELGTSIVTIKVTIPRNRQNDNDRTVIISPSEAKYLPENNSGPAENSNNYGNDNRYGNGKNAASGSHSRNNARDGEDFLL